MSKQAVLNMYEDAAEAALCALEQTSYKACWGETGGWECQRCGAHALARIDIPHTETCPIRLLREAMAAHRELEGGE